MSEYALAVCRRILTVVTLVVILVVVLPQLASSPPDGGEDPNLYVDSECND